MTVCKYDTLSTRQCSESKEGGSGVPSIRPHPFYILLDEIQESEITSLKCDHEI